MEQRKNADCGLTADYCFRVRKQWDYCCHVLICMVKTIVCRLCFTLTDYIIIGGSTHLNASSLHVNIYLILSLVDCIVKI